MKPGTSSRPCRLRKVCHLIDQDPRCWDETKVNRFFHPWDATDILKIKLSMKVRSAYRLALLLDHDLGAMGSSSSPMGERPIWNKLWKLKVPPKVHVFGWKAIRNRLPTRGEPMLPRSGSH